MNVLICPDKFKGSLSAEEVCLAVARGLKQSGQTMAITWHPMADGGDGSLDVLSSHLQLQQQPVATTDPLGREISTQYFTDADTAFIEMASASGLVLLTEGERNPLLTTTFGTGTMMANALIRGMRHIYLFLGGSATNDAGMGIAAALGCRFLDENNQPLEPVGGNLSKVQSIRPHSVFDFQKIKMTLLCDVNNPLYGPNGAAHVYARQKGATDEQVAYLDNGLRHFNRILELQTGMDVSDMPGIGAAGGIGASLTALFGAKLQSGFATISELTELEKKIRSADWIISGEGKLDSQSLQGKVVSGVAEFCVKHRKPLTLLVGKNELLEKDLRSLGAEAVYSIAEEARNLEDAMQNGEYYLMDMACRLRR